MQVFSLDPHALAAGPRPLRDRFELHREIGAGSAAKVYAATDRQTGGAAAVKVLTDEALARPGVLARFRQEAQLLDGLDHPYIIALVDHDLWGDRPAFALELAAHGSLRRRLADSEPPSTRMIVTWALDVLDALDHIHRRGIVHRDVKPANILVCANGTARLTDFGIALSPGKDMTRFGSTLGTPTYMPPEQALDPHTVTASADLFSLGASLLDIVSDAPGGRRASLLAGVPAPLRPVLSRATEEIAAHRYTDALDMHADMERALVELGGAQRVA